MIRVRWDLEEAVALVDLYYKLGKRFPAPDDEIQNLSLMLIKRAEKKGIIHDEKFRNFNGIRMQYACVHYVVTNGEEGLPAAGKIFYDACDLYNDNRTKFDKIANEFLNEYSI